MIQNYNSNLAASGVITAPSGVIDDLTTVSGAFSESLTVSGLPVQLAGGGGGSALTVKEADGSPSVANVDTIVVSNDTLTDDGGGQVTIQTGATGGGGSSGDGLLGRDFQGALLSTSSGTTVAPSIQQTLTWDTVDQDTSGFFDAGQPTRLTVPVGSGIEAVVIRAALGWSGDTDHGFRFLDLRQNGSAPVPAVASKIAPALSNHTMTQNLVSYPLVVSGGEYFELAITQANDSSNDIDTTSARTWFSLEDVTPSSGTGGGTSTGGGSGELTFSGTSRFIDPVRIRDARVPPITATTISGIDYDDEFMGDEGDTIDTGRWTIFDPGGNLTNDPPLIGPADDVVLVVSGDAAQAQESVGIIQTGAPDLDTNFSVFTKLDLTTFDGSNLDIYTGIIFVEDSTSPLTTNFILGGVRVQMESDTPTWEIGWYEFTDYTDTVPTRFSRYQDLNDANIQSLYLRVNRHFQAGLDRFDIAYSLDGIAGWSVVDTRTFANFALNTYDAFGLGSLEIDGFLEGPHYSFFRTSLSASSAAPTPSDFVVWERDLTSSGVNVSGTISGTGGGTALTVEEQDGSPSVANVSTIKVTDGSLTDEGGGVVSLDFATTGGGGGELTTSGLWFNPHVKPIEVHPRSDFFDDNSGQDFIGDVPSGTHRIDWDRWTLWDVDTVSGTGHGLTNSAVFSTEIGISGITIDTNIMGTSHDDTTGLGWVGFFQDVPTSGVDSVGNSSFTITAPVYQDSTFFSNSDIMMGVFIAGDLDAAPSTADFVSCHLEHVASAATSSNYSNFESILWSDYNSPGSTTATISSPYPGPGPAWVRLIYYGDITDRIEASISNDGIHFRELARYNNISATFTPVKMGFGMRIGSAGAAATAGFEFFSVYGSAQRGRPAGYGRQLPVITSASGVSGGGGGGLTSAVESLTASGSNLTGDVILEGLGSVSLHPSGQTVIISGGGLTSGGGSGNITDINAQTGPSITITGTGAVNTITDGNTITVNADNAFTPTAVSGCYTHEQTSSSSSWSITHNLDSPVVNYIVLDSVGGQVQPDLFTIDSDNAVTIDFISARVGTAHIFRCIDQALVNDATGGDGTVSGTTKYKGALATTSSGIDFPHQTGIVIPWDTTTYDTEGVIHDPVGNPTRLTVPPGTTKAQAHANILWDDASPTADGTGRLLYLQHRDVADGVKSHYSLNAMPGVPTGSNEQTGQNAFTPIVETEDGDYFIVIARQRSGVTVSSDNTFGTVVFHLEVKEPVTVTGISSGGGSGGGSGSAIDEGQVAFIAQVFA